MNKLTFTGLSILLIGIIMQRLIILYFSLPDSLSLPVQLVINLSEYYFLNTCAIITLHSLVRTIGFTPILRLPKSIKILLLVFLFEFYSIEVVGSGRFELKPRIESKSIMLPLHQEPIPEVIQLITIASTKLRHSLHLMQTDEIRTRNPIVPL